MKPTPSSATERPSEVTYGTVSERPKTFAGNRPRSVSQGLDGTIRLDAASAEVYGPALTFKGKFGNLGFWSSPSDHASWRFQADLAGVYTLAHDYACDDDSAGNAYEVRIGDARLRRIVVATGAWSTYRSLFVCETPLFAGPHRLELRPASPIRNALLDLRAVVLTPTP